MPNIRYDIDAELVKAQVAKKVASYEDMRVRFIKEQTELLARYRDDMVNGDARLWAREPSGPDYVDPMINKWIDLELNYYAKVRVIRLPKGAKRYILVYGDEDDETVTNGTGPFKTLTECCDWFLKSGR